MKHYRLPVTGIDERIQHLQDDLHDGLLEKWIIPDDQYQCFGRVYKNPTALGYRPEAYVSGGNYHPVELDDRYAVQSFFGLGDKCTVEGNQKVQDVHLVFFANLEKILLYTTGNVYNTALGDVRADMEIREAVEAIMGQNRFGFTWKETVITVQRATEGYSIGRANVKQTQYQTQRGEKNFDVHPNHIFRINGTVKHPIPQIN
jgi:hypothetical protein